MSSYIDLTHTLSEKVLPWPGKTPFKRVICAMYEDGYRIEDINLSTGLGTHMDSPAHFYQEKNAIDEIDLERLIAPAHVMNIANEVLDNGDYLVTANDIASWEQQHGAIQKNTLFLLHTGWERFWLTEQYCLQDANGVLHFPGIDKSAAQLLADREVLGVGIDTMSIDPGNAQIYVAHQVLLQKNIYIIENLANLAMLPPTGATVFALPIKIKNAPEAPVRAIARLPSSDLSF